MTADDALITLVNEGYDRADVVAVIDSLINAGLELDQPDDATMLTAGELDLVRTQLAC